MTSFVGLLHWAVLNDYLLNECALLYSHVSISLYLHFFMFILCSLFLHF